MKNARSQAELVTLRKLAQDIAAARKERLTSVHLLAAVAASEGPAAELLRDRRLDEEALLKASRSFDDEGPDPIGRLLAAARQIAARSPVGPPTALHLLLALLADRSAAAHRSLIHAGIDLARLRAAVMQVALGVVAARRIAPGHGAEPGSLGLRSMVTNPYSGEPGAAGHRPLGNKGSARTAPLDADPPRRAPNRMGNAPAGLSPQSALPPAKPISASLAQPGVAVPLFPPPPPARREPLRLSPGKDAAVPEPARRGAGHLATFPPVAPRDTAPRMPVIPAAAARFALDREIFPVLSSVGHNLSLAAAEGQLEEVVGRDVEIEKLLDILAKRSANSPCVVGPAGVGKTSVVRGLAHRFAREADEAETRILIEIVVSELLAGTGTRGALAEKIAAIRAEVRGAHGLVVLFIDEVHELFGTGALDEALCEIKIALSRGELRIIGATTPEEYRRSIECDPALARRFTVLDVEEPNEADAFLLIQSVAAGLGRHHALSYSDEAVAASVSWSTRYLPGRALPDKAISILDLAGARTRRKLTAEDRITGKVGPPEVADVVAELADLPIERLLETDRARMLALEATLGERVVGHGAAIGRIARVLRRNAAGLRGRRPIGSFLLLGPTGVGKTETAKAIAEALFHSPDAMTRLDFSEYAEAHAVARLVGAPPGYIGHEAGGQLTEAVRKRPYQVILLDEIEKAHRDVLEAFLQVLDEGRLTDGRGRRVDFTNAVIVMTSNLGAAEAGALKAERPVGFSRAKETVSTERLAEAMIQAARAHFPPELYNRIDEVLCFGPLSRAEVAEIARRLLEGVREALLARGVELSVEPEVIDALLAAGGFDVDFGARPMKRTIARLIENPLAELILREELPEGAVGLVSVERGEIVVDAIMKRKAAAAGGLQAEPSRQALHL
jgi:ATP-dependent Clp protease ATP-binding subunit ClpC